MSLRITSRIFLYAFSVELRGTYSSFADRLCLPLAESTFLYNSTCYRFATVDVHRPENP